MISNFQHFGINMFTLLVKLRYFINPKVTYFKVREMPKNGQIWQRADQNYCMNIDRGLNMKNARPGLSDNSKSTPIYFSVRLIGLKLCSVKEEIFLHFTKLEFAPLV